MTIPSIEEGDLKGLALAFPQLDFSDPEHRAVLLCGSKVDVQAAPGSGKTTILAARLYLLSRKWVSPRQGVCVISHTNTAGNEIRRRLSGTSEGARLLTYPHFIGTIHAFVNQYLALPWLRSNGRFVDTVDNEVFGRRAFRAAMRSRGVEKWASSRPNAAEDIIRNLSFSGPALEVVSPGIPSATSATGKYLRAVKRDLSREGIFRHDDMFAFAERALLKTPRLQVLLSQRFPLVMIDEMQDTSPSQAALLDNAFGDSVIVQRFGDINQRIFDGDEEGEVPFPETPILPMRGSRRFGPRIAAIVSKVQQEGPLVVGKGTDTTIAPTLLVYRAETIQRVIPRFGQLVLEEFDDTTLSSGGHIRAICARKSGDSQQSPGRHIGDFWPPLAAQQVATLSREANAWAVLSEDTSMGVASVELGARFERVRRIILVVLQQAKASTVDDVREPWQLFRKLRDGDFDLAHLRRVCRDIVVDKGAGTTEPGRSNIIASLHKALRPLLDDEMSLGSFATLDVFADPVAEASGVPVTRSRSCTVDVGTRSIEVTLGTVGATKGETHLATLYLESLGHPSRRFDVAEALGRITGRLPGKKRPPPSLGPQLRHVYVGVSRPTLFLCLAINHDRLIAEDRDILVNTGWRIEDVK